MTDELDVTNEEILKRNHENFIAQIKRLKCYINISQPPYSLDTVNQFQRYFNSSSEIILSFLLSINAYITSRESKFTSSRDSYQLLKNEYDQFLNYSETFLNNYSSSLKVSSTDEVNGNLSPSNPLFSNFSYKNTEEMTVKETSTISEKIHKIQEDKSIFLNKFSKLHRKVKNLLHKQKIRWKKIKNAMKRQRKKNGTNATELNEELLENAVCQMESETSDPFMKIMNFFQDFLHTGQWSWTDWNNSIRDIVTSSPVWFQNFSNTCLQMGIDFNHMFRSDLEAVESINIRLNSKTCGNQEFSNEKEGTSVLFTKPQTEDQSSNDTSNNNEDRNELYCKVCKMEFRSHSIFHIHLRGVRHIQQEIEQLMETDSGNKSEILDYLKDKQQDEETFEDNSIKCSECEFIFSKSIDLEKHKKLVHKPPKKSKTQDLEPIFSIQNILNQYAQPIVGLERIIEFQFQDSSTNPKYLCELCNLAYTKHHIIAHVSSIKHRLLYLKINWPALYTFLNQDKSKVQIKLKRLEIYCKELETIYGRSKLRVFCDELPNKDINVDNVDLDDTEYQYKDVEEGEVNSEDGSEETIINYSDNVQVEHEHILEAGELESSEDESNHDTDSKHLESLDKDIPTIPRIGLHTSKYREKLPENPISRVKPCFFDTSKLNDLKIKEYIEKENKKKEVHKDLTEELKQKFAYEVRLITGKFDYKNHFPLKNKCSKRKLNETVDFSTTEHQPIVPTNDKLLGNNKRLKKHATFLGIYPSENVRPDSPPSTYNCSNNNTADSSSAPINYGFYPPVQFHPNSYPSHLYKTPGMIDHFRYGYVHVPIPNHYYYRQNIQRFSIPTQNVQFPYQYYINKPH